MGLRRYRLLACCVKICQQLPADAAVRQVDASRVIAFRLEDIRRRRYPVMRRIVMPGCQFQRVGDDVHYVNRLVGDLVDEGGVRAILEQAPHEVWQEVFVVADGRVYAAWPIVFLRINDLGIQLLTHAMQTLELVIAARSCEVQDTRERMRIVRCELRVDLIARIECGTRSRQVRHVRMRLARKHRVAFEALLLRPLNLAVPIRTFHQPHRNTPTDVAGKFDQETHGVITAPLVRLQRHAESVPAIECRVAVDALENVEPHLEPMRLFGVDRQADTDFLRMLGEFENRRAPVQP